MEEDNSMYDETIQEGTLLQEAIEYVLNAQLSPSRSDYVTPENDHHARAARAASEASEASESEESTPHREQQLDVYNWLSDSPNSTSGYIRDPFLLPWVSGSRDSIPSCSSISNTRDSPVVSFVPGTTVCEMIKTTGEIPPGTVVVGPGESPVFLVGRGTPPRYPRTLVLPARVDVDLLQAFVSVDGTEYNIEMFEILMVQRDEVSWLRCYGGDVPVNAIPVGKEGTEPVYTARVFRQGRYWPGMVSSDDYAAIVSIGGVEKIFNQYEVLVLLPHASTSNENTTQD